MIRLIIALASITFLTGCVSVLPEPETPDALYRLGPVDPSDSIVFTRSVVVREPEAPRILSGVDMVARDDQGALRLVKGVEWADRVPRLFQMTLLDHLGGRDGGFAVLPETGARAEYELSWRLSEFSLEGNLAIARAELTLLDGKSREALRQLTVSGESRADSSNASDRANALAQAGRDIVRQAAAFIAEGHPTES